MSLLQDLDDYKLQTEFHTRPDIVLHRSLRADWGRGRQKVVVEEKWVPQKPTLGAGSFGTVRLEKLQNVDGDTQYRDRAVKQLRKMDMARMKVDFRKELLALTKFSRAKLVQSQAFVNFFGWFENDESIFIAMEYFQHGTLDRFITEALSEHDACIIAIQLLEGLRIMHEEQFTHRDLKPQNIFVVQHSPNWWVKIGDFGISKRVSNSDTALRTSTGTPNYLAPEIFHYVPPMDEESETYTNAVDIWSFACVLYEMMALQVPFIDWPRNLVSYCRVGKFPIDPLKRRMSSLGINFIKSLLIPFPSQRPTAEEALGSPWFYTETLNTYDTSIPSSTQTTTTNSDLNGSITLRKAYTPSYRVSTIHSNKEPFMAFTSRNSFQSAQEHQEATPNVGMAEVLLGTTVKSQNLRPIHFQTEIKAPSDTTGEYSPFILPSNKDLRYSGRSFGSIRSSNTPKPEPTTSDTDDTSDYEARSQTELAFRTANVEKPETIEQLRATDADPKRVAAPISCNNCQQLIIGDYHHCSLCNDGIFDLCLDCARKGIHCFSEEHWMVKRHVENGTTASSVTEIVKTPWVMSYVNGELEPKKQPMTLLSRGWRPSYKTKGLKYPEDMYDYCFQCGVTFPISVPPNRHVWEQHCTVDIPTQEPTDDSAEEKPATVLTQVLMKMPLPEELELHKRRMATMEKEMQQVFDIKVNEKKDKMQESEDMMYKKHKELSEQLESQRKQIKEKKAQLQAERLATPSPQPEKKRKSFFGRPLR